MNENFQMCAHLIKMPKAAKILDAVANLFALLNELRIAFENTGTFHAAVKDTTAYQIIGYINSHLSQPMSLDGICEKFCISKAQLCRIFRKVTGTSVWNYITVKRLVAAQSMILSGQPATRAFAECGFCDYSAFFRAYKNYFGYSPAETADKYHEGFREYKSFVPKI